VGKFLLSFLEVYGEDKEFQPRSHVVKVSTDLHHRHQQCHHGKSLCWENRAYCKCAVRDWDALVIEDPVCESNNTGRSCFRFAAVQQLFRKALRQVSHFEPLHMHVCN
jgi:hypothetical protein